MTHLFLFTIGPVQSFIAQARKTRDLYAGSQILSNLIDAGMTYFEKRGGTVIFPYSSSPSKPNRFLGFLNNESLAIEQLQQIGKEVDSYVKETWRVMANNAIDGLNEPLGFDQQIEQALETFWVFHPVTEETYHIVYQDIESTLGAIKNVRPVHQYYYQEEIGKKTYGERGRKCSLDGERNVKFYRRKPKDSLKNGIPRKLFVRNPEEVKLIQDRDGIEMSVIAPGEGLSAVSFVKRKTGNDQEFEPTAFFAATEFLNNIKNTPILSQKYAILKSCFPGSWDEQLLFEENYTDKYFEEQGISHHFGTPQKAKQKLLDFYDEAKKQNPLIKKSNGYYALFLFDGDNMGKWLSGANLMEGKNKGAALLQFHQQLAQLLSEFSSGKDGQMGDEGVYQYLKPPEGRTIYTGGDDFLGFINLERVFDVLKWTREQFDLKINQQIRHKKQDFTFSGGLVIAHYKTPLHVVLDWARATEKAAKKYIHPHGQRKDTLGISVLKASGEITQAFVPWRLNQYEEDNGQYQPKEPTEKFWSIEAMAKVVESLRKDFSDKWLRSLDAEFHFMKDRKDGALDLPTGSPGEAMVKAEMKRLLKRACLLSGDDKKREVDNQLLYLHSLLGEKPSKNFGNFSSLLYICDFIERHTNDKIEERNSSTEKVTAHA